MEKIREYFKLYLEFFKINIKSILIYDLDFLFGVFALILRQIMNFLILVFIFSFVGFIKGWSFDQILFLYAFSTTSFAIWHCLFINTVSMPYYIRTGTFDRFLLRPLNPIFQIMTDSFDEDGWGELLFGFLLLLVSILRLKLISFYLVMLPFLLIGASLIYASISLLGSSMVFLTIGNIDLANLAMDLRDFSKYPLTIYNLAFRMLFTIIIPIGFAAYYPSLFFIRHYHIGLVLAIISPIISILFFLLVCKIWLSALKYYSSTGS